MCWYDIHKSEDIDWIINSSATVALYNLPNINNGSLFKYPYIPLLKGSDATDMFKLQDVFYNFPRAIMKDREKSTVHSVYCRALDFNTSLYVDKNCAIIIDESKSIEFCSPKQIYVEDFLFCICTKSIYYRDDNILKFLSAELSQIDISNFIIVINKDLLDKNGKYNYLYKKLQKKLKLLRGNLKEIIVPNVKDFLFGDAFKFSFPSRLNLLSYKNDYIKEVLIDSLNVPVNSFITYVRENIYEIPQTLDYLRRFENIHKHMDRMPADYEILDKHYEYYYNKAYFDSDYYNEPSDFFENLSEEDVDFITNFS